MPRGKKELAIPFATSVEVEAYERSITVAAAHHHDSAAQCLGATEASKRGWSIGGQNPDLENSVIHGGRSPFGSGVRRG